MTIFKDEEKKSLLLEGLGTIFIREYINKYQPDLLEKATNFAEQIMSELPVKELFSVLNQWVLDQLTLHGDRRGVLERIEEAYGIDYGELIKE